MTAKTQNRAFQIGRNRTGRDQIQRDPRALDPTTRDPTTRDPITRDPITRDPITLGKPHGIVDAASGGAPDCLVYRGRVTHRRLKPFQHALAYSVFSLLLDVDALPRLSKDLKMLGYNAWAPVSVHDKDYGPRDGTPIRDWVRGQLCHHTLEEAGAQIRMLTFPRLWGYAFNPLTIYYCYTTTGALRAVLHEVSNTFGQSHGYLIPVEKPGDARTAIHQETQKIFHVSPFIEMNCRYRFALMPPGERLNVLIRQYDSDGDPILLAHHKAKGEALSDKSLSTALLRHPLMTLKVIAGIHWEALHLWRKGARFYATPPLPNDHVTR